ncbi:MAG: hypothetical protein A2151_03495 [Candidatus Muproteobacteria bacterium RBG_16_65_34]|uniref:PilZ domain-containing protein n=1 Tax=Candidatus Muproteobacteria bacterium RBG_16_65_34 TaxID=1817760 RepID=A0A1F6TKV8_9PROT|nr:MAG: hypothetical protein A2151_03495 [Candidatus Muproteobacteria bacterium RBG_16_65_34]
MRFDSGHVPYAGPDSVDADDLSAVLNHPHAPRRGLRRGTPLTATIRCGLTFFAAKPVRNISLTDAFVLLDPVELPLGRYVDFILHYRGHDESAALWLPATVRRAHRDGVAFEFGACDDATYTQLVKLIYAG